MRLRDGSPTSPGSFQQSLQAGEGHRAVAVLKRTIGRYGLAHLGVQSKHLLVVSEWGNLGGHDVRSRVLLRARAGNPFGPEHSALGPGLNTRPVTISPVPSFLGRRFESNFYRRFQGFIGHF